MCRKSSRAAVSIGLALVSVFLSSAASAVLRIEVTGTSGSGLCTWSFSGAATVPSLATDRFGGNDDVFGGVEGWNGFDPTGTWTTVLGISANILATQTDAVLSVDSVDYNLTTARVGTSLDGFLGVATDNLGFISLAEGDLVSWTGSFEVPIDVSALSSFTSSEHGGLGLVFVVAPDGIPTLGPVGRMGLALLLGLAAMTRRSRP